MLRFSGVSKAYKNNTVVPPFDSTVESGEVLVLLGPSGCGITWLKKTVTYAIRVNVDVATDLA